MPGGAAAPWAGRVRAICRQLLAVVLHLNCCLSSPILPIGTAGLSHPQSDFYNFSAQLLLRLGVRLPASPLRGDDETPHEPVPADAFCHLVCFAVSRSSIRF